MNQSGTRFFFNGSKELLPRLHDENLTHIWLLLGLRNRNYGLSHIFCSFVGTATDIQCHTAVMFNGVYHEKVVRLLHSLQSILTSKNNHWLSLMATVNSHLLQIWKFEVKQTNPICMWKAHTPRNANHLWKSGLNVYNKHTDIPTSHSGYLPLWYTIWIETHFDIIVILGWRLEWRGSVATAGGRSFGGWGLVCLYRGLCE